MGEPRALRRARPDDVETIRLLQRIAAIANEAASFPDAVQATLDEVCGYTGWPVGHAFIAHCPDAPLQSTDIWHIDDPKAFEKFRVLTEAMELRLGEGLAGRVAESGTPAWIRDVTVDSNYPRAHAGVEIGVRGGFGVPVLIGTHATAVLEFYARDPRDPDHELLEVMTYVGTQIGRVAEREMAAGRLISQIEQRQQLIDSAYDAFVSVDEKSRINGWNHAAEEMFGFTADEVIGRPLAATIIPHRYRDHHMSGVARYRSTGRSSLLNRRTEMFALHRDGHEFPVEISLWPVTHDNTTMFCAFIHDITERRKELERVKAHDEQLVEATEIARVGSWEWDIDNNVVTWSEQLYRNFGVSPAGFEPSFDTFMALVHPEDRAMVANSITHALDDLGSFEMEHRIIRPSDGAIRIHRGAGRVIVIGGRATKMAGTNQDVTGHARSTSDELLALVEDLIVQSPADRDAGAA